jgi:hypothetical protein
MLNRELSFHYECLQYTLREQPTASLQEELELLMARCCIHGHIPLTAVSGDQYPYLTGCMGRRSPTEFFRCLGLLHTENDMPVLRMNCPDLIREHLVLRLAFEHKTLDLLPDGWYEEPERFFFLYRLWFNHTERLRDQSDFWDRFFSAPSVNDIYNQLYAELLWSCTYHFPSHTQQAVDTLEARYKNDPGNERTAVYLAHCLFNLTCYQKSPQNRADTVLRLERLYDTHRDNQEITLEYAKGLFNLTLVQSEADIHTTVSDIADFLRAHPDAIPEFREALDKYLTEHPDHENRYLLLKNLGGDKHA